MLEVEKKFIRNFLSRKHFNTGYVFAFVTLGLCLTLSNFYWHEGGFLSSYLAVNKNLINQKHEYWRLFTSTFIHGDLDHFLSNSLMLGFLTYFVSSFYGGKYSTFIAFFMSGITNLIVIQFYAGEMYLVGASGVVYYLWGFWLLLYLLIQRQFSFPIRLMRVFGVFLILLIPTNYVPNTSYLAHYTGFILGVFVGLIYYTFHYKWLHSFELYQYKIKNDVLSPELEEAYLDSLK